MSRTLKKTLSFHVPYVENEVCFIDMWDKISHLFSRTFRNLRGLFCQVHHHRHRIYPRVVVKMVFAIRYRKVLMLQLQPSPPSQLHMYH